MKQKKKICKKCGEEKYIFSKGLCQWCASKNFKSLTDISQLNQKSVLKSSGKRIKQVTEKQIEKKQAQREKRSVYFDYHIKLCTHSEESGKPISNPNRSNVCHLLPKSSHPSLEDNLENYVYLTFKEHERFDFLLFSHRFEELEKEYVKSFPKVLLRLKKCLSLSEETTQLSIALKKYIDGRTNT